MGAAGGGRGGGGAGGERRGLKREGELVKGKKVDLVLKEMGRQGGSNLGAGAWGGAFPSPGRGDGKAKTEKRFFEEQMYEGRISKNNVG